MFFGGGGQTRCIMGDAQLANTDSLLQVDEYAHEQVTCVMILLMNASSGVKANQIKANQANQKAMLCYRPQITSSKHILTTTILLQCMEIS